MADRQATPTKRELAEIDRINQSGRQPIILVHGLWLLSGSWDRWVAFLEQQGYGVLAIDWPGDPETVAEARSNPDLLAGTSIEQVADHVEEIARRFTRRPAVIGHSVGGLVAQIVAGRGVAVATAAIDPVPFKGIRGLPRSVVKSTFPVLRSPGNRKRAVLLTLDQFRYGFANAVEADEANALYDEFHVPAPGKPIFQVASANFSRSTATKVDTGSADRGPLLIVSGTADHTVPPSLAGAAYKKQSKNPAPTEFAEIVNAGHSLVIDNRWQEVATKTVEFFGRNGVVGNSSSASHTADAEQGADTGGMA
ncbi:MAG: alpha/beta fold hydrolase [Actinomycetota bacterium]